MVLFSEISRIIKGVKWSHLGGEIITKNLRNKIQVEEVPLIRSLYSQGATAEFLANKYNVGLVHMKNILNRKTWKSIP